MRIKNPKPITLGIFESMEYMNNGAVPRRVCRACEAFKELFGYLVFTALICGGVVFLLGRFS